MSDKITIDPDYVYVPPLDKDRYNKWPHPKGTQCGECGMKFEYGMAYGYCCPNLNCPCGWGSAK